MKLKVRLVIVGVVLFLAVVYSIKRRFFQRRSVALDKYLVENKNRKVIPDENLDAEQLEAFNNNEAAKINCDSSHLTWTGIPYVVPSLIIEPRCPYYAQVTTVIYIFSNMSSGGVRSLIRETYGSKDITSKYDFKLIFVLGRGEPTLKEQNQKDFVRMMMQREQVGFDDILLVDVDDTFENEAVKGIAVLQWIVKCAKSVINIIKLNEYTVPNLPLLFNDLNSRPVEVAHRELFCTVETGELIEDKNKNISQDNPNDNSPVKVYPPYCRGNFIVFSKYIVMQILKASEDRPIFKMVDVYLTGLLRESVCIPVPSRRMRTPKIVKNRVHNIGAYHYIPFRKYDVNIFKNTWESALIFEKLIG